MPVCWLKLLFATCSWVGIPGVLQQAVPLVPTGYGLVHLSLLLLKAWSDRKLSCCCMALTDMKMKVHRFLLKSAFTSGQLSWTLWSRSCPTQTLHFSLPISQRHCGGRTPHCDICHTAKPSYASGKVNLALCPQQDKNRLIDLCDVNQGCVYLLGFTGLTHRDMCPPEQLVGSTCRECGAYVGSPWSVQSKYIHAEVLPAGITQGLP